MNDETHVFYSKKVTLLDEHETKKLKKVTRQFYNFNFAR